LNAKKILLFVFFLLLGSSAWADGITSAIYGTYACCSGAGSPYSNVAGVLSSPDVMFGTNTGWNWKPFGLSDFSADVSGYLKASSSGPYTFGVTSQDGSLLFIDNSLVINDGGTHLPTLVSNSVSLTAGVHPFDIQFFECCGAGGGIDLSLPAGVTFTNSSGVSLSSGGPGPIPLGSQVPEPNTLILLGTGLLGAIRAIRGKIRS